MAVGFSNTNKPINPRGNDASPKAFNRAKLYSGKALDFDGVNDTINEQTISVSSASFSVSFYAKADNYASPLCALSIGTSGTFDLVFYPYDDFIGDGVRIYDAQISSNLLYGVTAELGVYNMFTLQCDGEYLEVYINGQFAKKEARTYSSTYTAIKIGSILGGTQYYNGQIAGFKIFNTALTAAQVADLYNNPEKVVPTGVDNTALKLWLPMQEGAGTTAYDGSGNGNHGTISGATYTHGIGAPVSQTAVIDWNKGSNFVRYSEDFSNAAWVKAANNATLVVTGNYATAPNGTSTADRIQMSQTAGGSNYSQLYYLINGVTNGVSHTWSVWLKSLSGTPTIGIGYDGSNWSTITLTTEWKEYKITKNTLATTINADLILYGALSTSLSADFLAWGFSVRPTSAGDAYIPTFATAQTSPVLLPQGLTTGRDITGVNLFENVRKQGALNLDGNSWAEVHDNASLDISPAMTMEAWFNCDDISSGSYETIFAKPSGTTWVYPYAYYNLRVISTNVQWWFEGTFYLAQYDVSLTGWNHLLVTKNGTSEILYINGVQVATHTGNAAISASPYDLILGANTDKMEKASSQIAQPRIYNRALTAAEVLQNYNSGKNTYK